METKQRERLVRISEVTGYIEKILEAGSNPVKKDVVLWAVDSLNISKRTATEYVEVAFRRLNIQVI